MGRGEIETEWNDSNTRYNGKEYCGVFELKWSRSEIKPFKTEEADCLLGRCAALYCRRNLPKFRGPYCLHHHSDSPDDGGSKHI